MRAEHAELMRLRGQVGLLGRQAQQAGKETVSAEETPKASRPLRLNEYLARKEWADAGGESPEAALQTLFWALSVTNLNRAAALIKWDMNAAKELLPPLDPITRASRIDDIPAFMQDAVSRMSESVAKLAGLRLVSSKTNTEGQAVLGFEAPGEDGKSTEGSLRFFRTVSGQWGPLMKVRNVEGAIALDWAEPEAEH